MKSKKLPSSSEAAALAEKLTTSPRENANNLPVLISILGSNKHQVLPIIQSLKLYFIGCFERDELNVSLYPPADQSPEAVYTNWLHRQYSQCLETLLTLLHSGTEARTQVAALSLLTECVRGETVGSFNNELFTRIVTVAVSLQGVTSEVLGALLTKYATYADVRFYMLKSLIRVCERHAARGPTVDTNDKKKDDGGTDDKKSSKKQNKSSSSKKDNQKHDSQEDTKADDINSGSRLLSSDDLARTIFDVLLQLPDIIENADLAAALGVELQGVSLQSSWCGAAEFGLVKPSEDDGAGSRQRKKQKRLESAEPTAPNNVQKAKWANGKIQKRVYSDAWLAFLRLDLPEDVYKKVLSQLPDTILPKLFNPLLLSDFLTYSLDKGGLIGMLSLNGIFLLVTQHGLEYPKFYEKLYNLLTADAFQAKYRVRFFQLADIFLASGMVPAYSAAAFVKRFGRLALTASPAGALVCVAFIHNIIRRHPACMQLLHRAPLSSTAPGDDNDDTTTEKNANSTKGAVYEGVDVYDETEIDPAQSRALESSLWEITALRQHANPLVANFCQILDKDLSDRVKTSEVDVNELLAGSYTSMFTKEVERRLKQAPTAFYAETPKSLFEKDDPNFAGWVL